MAEKDKSKHIYEQSLIFIAKDLLVIKMKKNLAIDPSVGRLQMRASIARTIRALLHGCCHSDACRENHHHKTSEQIPMLAPRSAHRTAWWLSMDAAIRLLWCGFDARVQRGCLKNYRHRERKRDKDLSIRATRLPARLIRGSCTA